MLTLVAISIFGFSTTAPEFMPAVGDGGLAAFDQRYPNLSSLGSDRFVTIYEDRRRSTAFDDVYGEVLTLDGGVFVPLVQDVALEVGPYAKTYDLVACGPSTCLLVFLVLGDVYVQCFDATLTPLDASPMLANDCSGTCDADNVIWENDGWRIFYRRGNTLFSRRVEADGTVGAVELSSCRADAGH